MTSPTKSILIFIFLSSYFNSHGQNAVGLKAGINIAYRVFQEEITSTKLPTLHGFQIGGLYNICINSRLFVQPELLFIQKGYKDSDTFRILQERISTKSQTTLNFVELPLLIKLNFGDLNNANFFFTAGPSFGFILDGKIKHEISYNNGTTNEITDPVDFGKSTRKRFELSAALGAGVGFPFGKGKLSVETRYLYGLTNLTSTNNSNRLTNRGLGITAGYMTVLN